MMQAIGRHGPPLVLKDPAPLFSLPRADAAPAWAALPAAAIAALSLCLPDPAHAATPIATTATIPVSATVTRGCQISGSAQTTGLSFGLIDFGVHSPVRTGTHSVMATGGPGMQAQVLCTPGTTLQVTVGSGLHASGAQRRLSNGSQFIPYALTLMATGSPALLPNVAANMALGATPTALPIQATATFPGTGLGAGTYTDTVQVTLSW
ncbi:spore coat protein U domain-containing protein [Acidovorax sp. NCPPB 3576]|uniref:spore coat protein U domain-containing protein n=1 Tax=Acidovorax sp. NCPPB 3576 TaxID=2940488 RepID=UPI00234A19A6|nr:spore coat protein U domain-containing protein [Acidovorax sp. NCPPB 3576]WCM88720.1 spore coat U domain-containing protein [Acidovorax sp. NCPPB 3576]